MIELKKRAQKQKQQQKLKREKAILKKLDTILADSEAELETLNNAENGDRPDSEEELETLNNAENGDRPDYDQIEEKHTEETNNNETKENTSRRIPVASQTFMVTTVWSHNCPLVLPKKNLERKTLNSNFHTLKSCNHNTYIPHYVQQSVNYWIVYITGISL